MENETVDKTVFLILLSGKQYWYLHIVLNLSKCRLFLHAWFCIPPEPSRCYLYSAFRCSILLVPSNVQFSSSAATPDQHPFLIMSKFLRHDNLWRFTAHMLWCRYEIWELTGTSVQQSRFQISGTKQAGYQIENMNFLFTLSKNFPRPSDFCVSRTNENS